MTGLVKRVLIGRPVGTGRLGETRLSKTIALPVFCSDPISSVAYATEQIVLVLGAGGLAYLSLATPVAVLVALLLVVVVASYRQTVFAYPNGGGAYVVSKENLGERSALMAASALLVDYVMTVAVSVTSGVVAVTSAFRFLTPYAAPMSAVLVMVLALVNLRGVRESGRAFAVPTYAFIGLTYLMFAFAVVRGLFGDLPPAESSTKPVLQTTAVGGVLTAVLLVRAFASGCTALTGVEAISNGVPAFRAPQARNAAATLVAMGVLAVTMFGGITVLAVTLSARAEPDGNPSVLSQIAASSFGTGSALFYLYQAATAGILVLAANTAFNGFPLLASLLGRERYLPRQLSLRGDRLAFSNGILLLAVAAAVLILAFDANLEALLHLYIIGVFTSFTLSQTGMVRHWSRERAADSGVGPARIRRAQAVNLTGAVCTAIVLVVVFATKVTQGAWIAVLAMALLFLSMRSVNRYYGRFEAELTVGPDERPTIPASVHAIVLVVRVNWPVLHAIALAHALHPDSLEGVTAAQDEEEAQRLRHDWQRRHLPIPLRVLDAPYRDIGPPLLQHIRSIAGHEPRSVVTVFLPEYVVAHWWQNLLHNQSARRLKGLLQQQPGVVVVSVPFRLGDREQGWLAGARQRPTTEPERPPSP